MVLDETNNEIQKFSSEKEFFIYIIKYQKIKLLFSVKKLYYQEEEHLLLYLDKNCFGYYNELYNSDIIQKENVYLMYNYGFFRTELTVCKTFFEKDMLVEKIMDEIILCGSSLYE